MTGEAAAARTGTSRHTLHEDAVAILIGALLVSLGVLIYARAMLLVGGVAGVSLLLAYVTPVGFWTSFFVLNLPFYWLAWQRKGRAFVVRTVFAVTLECLITRQGTAWIDIGSIDPVFAAVVGGALVGLGLMCLFRHNTSLGGVGVLALYLQERHGIRAGYVQMVFDVLLLLAAASILPPWNLFLSLLGAVAMNGVLALYHRPDRYVGIT